MTPYSDLISKFVGDLVATCPPGYELDAMSLDRPDHTNNTATVTVWWKPVGSAPTR